jgi:uncharacterized protein with von Willebrand factor type A (vWA) domain
MKEVESILEPISGNFKSLYRNPMEGWFEMEIGIPNNWVFNENEEIGVEIISENEVGKLLRIFPKNSSVVADDLILFVKIVINTNQKIAEKEEEFKKQMEEMKKGLEKKASEFFKELDELKENSFKKLNDKFVDGLNKIKKERKKRTPKVHIVIGDTGTTKTNSSDTFTIK